MTTDAERWNHNIHYHPIALPAVPYPARRALDVECGDGLLAGTPPTSSPWIATSGSSVAPNERVELTTSSATS